MSFFTQSGDMFAPTAGRESLLDTLPVGNFIVVETQVGLMFKRVDAFSDPGRMYGNIESRAERIFNTFLDRPRTTGVLLEGEKGSGKSQLARNLSRLGYAAGMPTILVNAPFCGDAFNALLATIEQPAIILMDEFEKVYEDKNAQEAVLTLLDGMMTSKKLFVLTVNDTYKVNEHMKNRPGRLYYSIKFTGLEADFIRDYCADNLHDVDQAEDVVKVAALFQAFNFDLLKALVEEMNRYKEDAFEALELLNAKPFTSGDSTTYDTQVILASGIRSRVGEDTELPMTNRNGHTWIRADFDEPVGVGDNDMNAFFKDLGLDAEEIETKDYSRNFNVSTKNIKRVDVDAGRYEFYLPEDKVTVTFTKRKVEGFSYREYMH